MRHIRETRNSFFPHLYHLYRIRWTQYEFLETKNPKLVFYRTYKEWPYKEWNKKLDLLETFFKENTRRPSSILKKEIISSFVLIIILLFYHFIILSCNINAIPILEKNVDKIDWIQYLKPKISCIHCYTTFTISLSSSHRSVSKKLNNCHAFVARSKWRQRKLTFKIEGMINLSSLEFEV